MRPKVSVVIIGKDVAPWLGRCISSLESDGARADVGLEIVYVDSKSSDNSVEIAAQLKAMVVQRAADIPPFAGRLLGANLATGEYVQFIDADMETVPGWFASALRAMDEEKGDVLCGKLLSAAAPAHPPADRPQVRVLPLAELGHADHGAPMVRGQILREEGAHYPTLLGYDNSEFLIRYAAHGRRVLSTTAPIAVHLRTREGEGLADQLIRKWRHQYPGCGQALKLAVAKGGPYGHAILRRLEGPLLVFAGAVAVLAVALAGPWGLLGRALILGGVILLALAVQTARKGSLSKGAGSVMDACANALGLVAGLFLPVTPPAEFVEKPAEASGGAGEERIAKAETTVADRASESNSQS